MFGKPVATLHDQIKYILARLEKVEKVLGYPEGTPSLDVISRLERLEEKATVVADCQPEPGTLGNPETVTQEALGRLIAAHPSYGTVGGSIEPWVPPVYLVGGRYYRPQQPSVTAAVLEGWMAQYPIAVLAERINEFFLFEGR